MFSIIRNLLNSKKRTQSQDLTKRMIRGMGGDPSRLTPAELMELTEENEKLASRDDNVSDWFKQFAEHGTAMVTRQRDLLKKTGALEHQRNQQSDRDAARRALLAQDVPVLNAKQRSILTSLPEGKVRDFFASSMRTALIFDPVLRPASPDDHSFCGGMPFAPSSMIWPHTTGKDGRRTPCRFLCQFDLADLPADFGLRKLFPDEGALFVFEPPKDATTSDPLVQHHTLNGAFEHTPPAGLEPYTSHYRNHALPELKTGWLYENDVPPLSVGPKWPLAPRLETQAPTSYHCYDYNLEIPNALLEPFGDDPGDFFEHMFDALNAAGGRLKPRQLRIDTSEFDCFPHVWGVIQRLLEQHILLVDLTEAFYHDRIAANAGQQPECEVPSLWIKGAEKDRTAEINRTRAALTDLAELRLEIQAWQQLANKRPRNEATSAKDRKAFMTFWRSLDAEGGIMLEDRFGSPEWGVNSPTRMLEFYQNAVAHGVIGSLSTDPSVFPDDIANRLRKVAASWHPTSSIGPIQILGHTAGIQGSEAPGEDLLLLQLPYSLLCDWSFGAGGAIQFWLSHADFQLGNLDAVQIEVGT